MDDVEVVAGEDVFGLVKVRSGNICYSSSILFISGI